MICGESLCEICLEEEAEIELYLCKDRFCQNCLQKHIMVNKKYPTPCPDEDCTAIIEDLQCYEILEDSEDKKKFAERAQTHRYLNRADLYPCYNDDCRGSIKKEGKDQCRCDRCDVITCFKCRATHKENETCEMWVEEHHDFVNSRKNQKLFFQDKVNRNEGMMCPKCGVYLEKMDGCDGVTCQFCQTDICFRTKQSRWGPGGRGDISGGCKCRADGKTLCHENCVGCH